MDGCISYAQLTSETTPLMGAFSLWCQFQNRDLIKEEHSELRATLDGHLEYFKSRREYLSNMLPLLHELHGRNG
jgi:hypothetical protein